MHEATRTHVGLVGTGLYIPSTRMTAREVSEATGGKWAEKDVINKLGFVSKPVPGPDDGTQEMGVRASLDCLKKTGVDPLDIDLILCIGEEHKEYPLTTSGIYIQEKIGAHRAWAIDVQQRCATCVTTFKIAKDMMLANEDINTVLVCGGYRNVDFIDYQNPRVSFMYNLGAGGAAALLKKNYGRNELLDTAVITDGSFARDVGVLYGGTVNPIDADNWRLFAKSLDVMDVDGMKSRLNEKSTPNFLKVIRDALAKGGYTQDDIGYLGILHFKYSAHKYMLEQLGVPEEKTTYLRDYGHIGQLDQILSLTLGLEQGKVQDGDIVVLVGAGIGYAWAACTLKWGPVA